MLKLWIWPGLLLLAGLLVLAGRGEQPAARAYDSGNLLRLHVIANSDDPRDQAMKLAVRDAVLAELQEPLANLDSAAQAEEEIALLLPALEEAGRRVVREWGSSYAVRALLGSFDFPTKAYGDVVLPAGNYRAVRVLIGAGQGENWWCVLFPPLCLVDITTSAVPHGATPVMTGRKQPPPPELRFKVLEVLEATRHRLAGLF